MSIVWEWAKGLSRALWFREGKVRKAWFGPYAGLRFFLCPQMIPNRLRVFYSAYEPEVADRIDSAVSPGMTVYDAGAHVGIHALYMARRVGKGGTVCAFEPWLVNRQVLEKNVELNRDLIGRVVAVPKAVCDKVGKVQMSQGPTDGTHHLAAPGEAASVDVEATTLDAFAAESGLAPDLILVDVEGAEMSVLKGAEGILRQHRPELLLEHHGAERSAALSEYLKAEGYVVEPVGRRHIFARHPGRAPRKLPSGAGTGR